VDSLGLSQKNANFRNTVNGEAELRGNPGSPEKMAIGQQVKELLMITVEILDTQHAVLLCPCPGDI